MEAEQKSTSEMSMNNDNTVIEVSDESEIQTSEPSEDKNECRLLRYTIDLIKDQTSQPNRDEFFVEKSPMGNTVLHIAALYGDDNWVEKITQNASHLHLLAEKNANDDTALHVAARAGQISILKKLLASLLHNLPHSYSENPKEALYEILAKNEQGNTFFHEALLNDHKDVMKILGSQELQMEAGHGFRELVERAALFWTNKEEKSVLHLAIEKGYENIVEDALTRLISEDPALEELIENHQELTEMIEGKLPLFEQDQAVDKKGRDKHKNRHCSHHQSPEKDLGHSKKLKETLEFLCSGLAAIFGTILQCICLVFRVVKYSFTTNIEIMSKRRKLPSRNRKHQEPAQLIPYGRYYVPPQKSSIIDQARISEAEEEEGGGDESEEKKKRPIE